MHITPKVCSTVQVAMLEPKIALTLLSLIIITTCQSFDSNVHEPELDPKGGSIAENLQIWKFKDGYLINKQLGKNYSYGNVIWSLGPVGSKSYFHIVQTCKTVSGAVPNMSCIFPFKTISLNELETYSTCIRGGEWNDWTYWFPIKVDESGVYEHSPEDPNTWGNCGPDCQIVDTPVG